MKSANSHALARVDIGAARFSVPCVRSNVVMDPLSGEH
jgi:hypothetical protein